MTPEELRRLLSEPESDRLEYKRNVPKDPRRVAEAVAAFANTHGGTLVIGYEEPTKTLVGLSAVDRDVERVENALRRIRPPLNLHAQRLDLDGKSVIVLEIPEGDRFPYRADGRVVQRSGTAVTPISAELAVRRAESSPAPKTEERDLAEAIAEQGQLIEDLRRAAAWQKQLPLQIAVLAAGVLLGYLIAGWNPIGFH